MTASIEDSAPLRRADDGTESAERVPLTTFRPASTPRGGIVVLHESREFSRALLDFMKALAEDGWLVAAPHLFHRAASDDEVFGDALFEDFDATVTWLTGHGVYADTIGVIGFDDAGTAAALVATDRPVGAAVSVAAPGIVEPLTADARALNRGGAVPAGAVARSVRPGRRAHPGGARRPAARRRRRGAGGDARRELRRPRPSSRRGVARVGDDGGGGRGRRRSAPHLRLVRQPPALSLRDRRGAVGQRFCVRCGACVVFSLGGSKGPVPFGRRLRRRARAAEWESLLMT